MFAKTKHIKKTVFFSAASISALMTALLFYQFGSSLITSILFVVIGISIQVYQILCLLQWQNSQKSKNKKYTSLFQYSIITISSCIATLAFGLNQIDKTIASKNGLKVEIEYIKKEISILQNKPEVMNQIKKQIRQIEVQIPKLTYNIAERTIFLNSEINKLKKEMDLINNISSQKEKNFKIMELKKQLAAKEKNNVDIKGAFQIISEVFGISLSLVMVIFLGFITISIEMMIYSTSEGGIEIQSEPIKAKTKPKRDDQIRLRMVG